MSQGLEMYFSLLNNKLDRVREAESLTLVQYKLIEDGKYDELTANLQKRNAVMEQFGQIGEKIESLNIGTLSGVDEAKVRALEENINTVFAKIREDNAKLKSMLEDKKSECREEIKQLSENKKGALGYAQYSYDGESLFFDKKS